MHNQIFIGLGSNMGDSNNLLNDAAEMLANHESVEVLAMSSLYTSAPMGPKNQPDYVNAVCQISTLLTPHELLKLCQHIEDEHGRKRDTVRWGPRTLDLDILLIGDQRINSDDLVVPHPGMGEREFVLVPLFELVPDMVMPDGQPLAKWVAACTLDGLKRLR